MAAAAYAFLVSLLNTMDQIELHSRLSTCFDIFQFQSLRQKVDFLLDFVENHSGVVVGENIDADIPEGEALLRQIAVVAQMVEDKIEVEVAYRIIHGSTNKSLIFLLHLEKIKQGMDSIMEEVMKMKAEMPFAVWQHTSAIAPPPSSSSSSSTAKTNAVVGFNGYLERVLDELTGYHSGRRILPIVGIGGIVHEQELGEKLYKLLCSRRYLIVLDDLWSVEAWERIKVFFLENNNGSRIVVTTRQGEVVDYFGSSALVVDFLDESDSWELFCGKAFAGEGCPPELEKVGRKIVEKCKGLPLGISVIGGLLSKSPRTQQYWEEMAKDKSLGLENSEEGNKALSILYLSYKHLPACLRPCFLYMGLFLEDHITRASFLVKLWVSEGFIKSNTHHTLEEVAESYIKELVDRNLLLVGRSRRELNKQVELYSIHDFVRELCIKIGEKEQFCCVQRDLCGKLQYIVDERTARFYPRSESLASSKRPSVMKPLIFQGQREAPFKSRLFRVLVTDTNSVNRHFPLNLRFFFQKCTLSPIPIWQISSSTSLCWSLQTVILKNYCSVILPSEIWKMPQIRHIVVDFMYIQDPHPDDDSIALLNLQTLKRVKNLNLNEEVCKRIPNIKELEVDCNLNEHVRYFSCLNKLESLCYRFTRGCDLVQGLTLPSSLKELSLWNFHLLQSDMAMIASLPHLQSLTLIGFGGMGTTWDCVEGELTFVCLKNLRIDHWIDPENWVAGSSNFPVLETLKLWNMVGSLKEIPLSFGEIPTLESLVLRDCNELTTIMSAINIQQIQESLGNLDFLLTLEYGSNSKAQVWRAKIEELGITSQNIHIKS